MTNSTATLERHANSKAEPVRQPIPLLSLTKAAETVGMSTSTIRRAIKRGELEGRTEDNGDYRIRLDRVLEFKNGRDEREARKNRKHADTTTTRTSTHEPAQQATEPAADTVDSTTTGLSAENAELRIRMTELSSDNRNLRDRVRDIATDRDHWRTMATTSADSVKLLTDQREVTAIGVQRNRRMIRYAGSAGMLSLVAAAIAGIVWRPELKQLWLHLTNV